ncbi:MAG: F0F1 ATP synthase subunit A [Propylenella sp.]
MEDRVDPIHQFAIANLVDLGTIGGVSIAFTNSALFMVVIVVLITAFMVAATTPRNAGRGDDDIESMVPGPLQSLAEIAYEFVANMLRESAGKEGMRFFPFVFSVFMFVLFANVIGLFPYFFTVTSHIAITAGLAVTIILMVILYGFYRNGLHFLGLFVPKGVPVYLLPLVVAIEVMSFLSRPISLSVRLFANMLAGHITLKVFASFILMLGAFGFAGWLGAIIPFFMTVALTALEVLVAFLQAYVFAILTCMYLNDALHPSH